MKRLICVARLILIAMAFCLVLSSCNNGKDKNESCVHTDLDFDGICDKCDLRIEKDHSECVDKDGNSRCDICGAQLCKHTYDSKCDKECNSCGKERESVEHEYYNACDKDCNLCGEIRSTADHVFLDSCNIKCKVCGEERVPPHVWDNACDVECNACFETRATAEHVYDNDCDSSCNECNASRIAPHVWDNACDKNCNLCDKAREPANHVYDNACDVDCNVCNAVRGSLNHKYDNNCDVNCNECGEIRTPSGHIYDNDCDSTCNECKESRVPSEHIYDNDCDDICNECSAQREAPHSWDNACDVNCNECGDVRIPSDHTYDHDYDPDCNVCNELREVPYYTQGLEYILNNDNISYALRGYGSASDLDIVIPSIYNGLPVTRINGISSKGDKSITSVRIPHSVTYISPSAFRGCDTLNNVIIDDNNSYYKTVDNNIYSKDGKKFVLYLENENEFKVPDGVNVISLYAFNNCKSIERITISSSVVTVGDHAFYCCPNLKSVVLSDNTKSIGKYAFDSCTSLETVFIPAEVKEIGICAFINCNRLTSVIIDENNVVYKSVGNNIYTKDGKTLVMYLSNELESFVIPTKVTTLAPYAFTSELSKIYIGTTVEKIEENAIVDSIYVTNIYYYGNDVQWGKISSSTDVRVRNLYFHNGKEFYSSDIKFSLNADKASYSVDFYDYSSGFDILIPSIYNGLPVSRINDGSYYYSGIKSVVIPESVEYIGAYAFDSCLLLREVKICGNISYIGVSAFDYDTGLTIYCTAKTQPESWPTGWNNFNIPIVWDSENNDVADDGYIYTYVDGIRYAIKDGKAIVARNSGGGYDIKIDSLIIRASIEYNGSVYPVTEIGDYAFDYWQINGEVVIPDTIVKIGDYAFYRCIFKKDLTLPDSITYIGEGAFYDFVINGDTFIIPAKVTYIGDYAFSIATGLTKIVIPKSVTYIGLSALQFVTDIYYTGSESDWAKIDARFYDDVSNELTVHYNYIPEEV